MRKTFFTVLSLFTAVNVFAQDSTTKPEEEKKSPFTFSGYVDTYFFGNLNAPKSKSNEFVVIPYPALTLIFSLKVFSISASEVN